MTPVMTPPRPEHRAVPRCSSANGQHDFKPRYDEKPNPTVVDFAKVAPPPPFCSYSLPRDALVILIYVRDVCPTCGAVLERTAPP